ncbi:MAG: amino acid adenylation domain-containing protein [Hydrococcus sp. Prado102]|jgi:amino acid adenylation domain-containing protein|nr:amino acid adenylation domain-containing protein [Hydrococcus sp. Prado102]
MMIVDKPIQANTILKASNSFSDKFYWLNKLSGNLPETKFINDYIRSSSELAEKQTLSFELSKNLSSKILSLSQKSYLSTYLLLLAVFNIFLYKYTNHKDILVGSPIYEWKRHEKLVNRSISLLFHVEDTLTFKEFLLEVKKTTIESYCHPNYSIEELAATLNQSSIPLILLENIHNVNDLDDRDIIISFAIEGNSITGQINYNRFLFKPETIDNICKQYINLIETLINNVGVKISGISWVSEQEKQRLLKEFNCNTKHYPVTLTLQQLFEKQVDRTPNNIAVVDRERRLTYQELNKKANQLAKFLQQLEVKSGDLVAILKERNIDFLVAILAILKAGGVYVPIDSTYPPERIKYMLANSEVKTVLTDSSCLDIVKDCPHLQHIICLDSKRDRIDFEKLPQENLEVSNKGIDPAYTIYTSGSTGLPKGAIIRHGGASNHIYAQFDALELSKDFTFLQSAPASSDISVWQFLAPILIGGRTVIADTETVFNPEKLFKIIQEEKITIVELVPVVLKNLLDYISHLSPRERLLPHLKWMMVTGESVSVALVNRWLDFYPSIKVVNAYGPTEAADDITQFIIDKPLPENQRTVPIGKPLANLNLYILDPKMQLVPIGVPGEICVSGFGVGLGYWKNQTSTNSSFIPNPFINTAKPLPGTDTDFIYKTGDLGRWLPDGNIEFLGRIDHQVKIRGFRVELGEIETFLSQHPNVRESVVVVRQEEAGNSQIVAYIVAETQPVPSISELRNFLKEKLPDHMLPSAFVMLESLPLTPSGKVDRNALPKPDNIRPELETAYVLPRNEIERAIVDIWQKILKVEKVGIQDNFFDLGGHSLNLLQVYSKLKELFKADLAISDLFKYPTISSISRYLSQEEDDSFANQSNELNEELEVGKARLKQRFLRNQQQNA